jgi:hypothetical protein
VVVLETQPRQITALGLTNTTTTSFRLYFVETLILLPLHISFSCNTSHGVIARNTLPHCYPVTLKTPSNTCMIIISPDRSSHGEKGRRDIPWKISCWAALAIAASASFPQRRIRVWPRDAELPRTADPAVSATAVR